MQCPSTKKNYKMAPDIQLCLQIFARFRNTKVRIPFFQCQLSQKEILLSNVTRLLIMDLQLSVFGKRMKWKKISQSQLVSADILSPVIAVLLCILKDEDYFHRGTSLMIRVSCYRCFIFGTLRSFSDCGCYSVAFLSPPQFQRSCATDPEKQRGAPMNKQVKKIKQRTLIQKLVSLQLWSITCLFVSWTCYKSLSLLLVRIVRKMRKLKTIKEKKEKGEGRETCSTCPLKRGCVCLFLSDGRDIVRRKIIFQRRLSCVVVDESHCIV